MKVFETPVVERTAIDDTERKAVDLPVRSCPRPSCKPGLYTCQVNVVDEVSGRFAFPRLAVYVKAAASRAAASAPSLADRPRVRRPPRQPAHHPRPESPASRSAARARTRQLCSSAWRMTQVPPTRTDTISDTLHGVEIADPYRWLEGDNTDPQRSGPGHAEVAAWTDAQNALHARGAR